MEIIFKTHDDTAHMIAFYQTNLQAPTYILVFHGEMCICIKVLIMSGQMELFYMTCTKEDGLTRKYQYYVRGFV